MRSPRLAFLLVLLSATSLHAKVIVFSEPGFPTVASEPVQQATLTSALGQDVVFAGIDVLGKPETLHGAELLVLPYGSACPVQAWTSIETYLHAGGNLLILGGQPFRVPVTGQGGRFAQQSPQDTYARTLDFRHTYEVPAVDANASFAWREGYGFLPPL